MRLNLKVKEISAPKRLRTTELDHSVKKEEFLFLSFFTCTE